MRGETAEGEAKASSAADQPKVADTFLYFHHRGCDKPHIIEYSLGMDDSEAVNKDGDGFDWQNSDAVVIRTVAGIAIYSNARGEVVVRQESLDRHTDPEDSFVIIPRDRVEAVINALQEELANNATHR